MTSTCENCVNNQHHQQTKNNALVFEIIITDNKEIGQMRFFEHQYYKHCQIIFYYFLTCKSIAIRFQTIA